MGAGTNVQERLVALHHLDVPWRPSDLEQREGRIDRQGNLLYERDPDGFEIEINRYATKNTLDSRMWQIIETKAKFIEQIKTADLTDREIEDIGSSEAMNSAEMKAESSGNPLILEEMDLKQKVKKLEAIKKDHNRKRYGVQSDIRYYEIVANRESKDIEEYESDLETAHKLPKKFMITINGVKYDKREEAGEKIKELSEELEMGKSIEIGSYGDFALSLEKSSWRENGVTLLTTGKREYEVDFNCQEAKAGGLMIKLTNKVNVNQVEAKIYEVKEEAKTARERLPKLKEQDKEFPQEDELQALKDRHSEIIDALKDQSKEDKNKQTNTPEKEKPFSTIKNNWTDPNPSVSTQDIVSKIRNFDSSVLKRLGEYSFIGNCLVLDTQLERNDYLQFKKVFDSFGGIWDTKKQAIVFSESGIARIKEALDNSTCKTKDTKGKQSNISEHTKLELLYNELSEINTKHKGDVKSVACFIQDAYSDGYTALKQLKNGDMCIVNEATAQKYLLRDEKYTEYADLYIKAQSKLDEMCNKQEEALQTYDPKTYSRSTRKSR
jgi:hypothetical protein